MEPEAAGPKSIMKQRTAHSRSVRKTSRATRASLGAWDCGSTATQGAGRHGHGPAVFQEKRGAELGDAREALEGALRRDEASSGGNPGRDAVEGHEAELHGGRRGAVPELAERFREEFLAGDGWGGVGELPAAHPEADVAGHGRGVRERETAELDRRGRGVAQRRRSGVAGSLPAQVDSGAGKFRRPVGGRRFRPVHAPVNAPLRRPWRWRARCPARSSDGRRRGARRRRGRRAGRCRRKSR